jgi:hypothetical protein
MKITFSYFYIDVLILIHKYIATMINTLTFSQDATWSLSHPSSSTVATIQAWGAGGHGGSTGNGGSGGGFAEITCSLGNGDYPIVVGQPTEKDGGLSSFTSASVVIVQAPGGKIDGTVDEQASLLTGSSTAIGGHGSPDYKGYSSYNGSGGGSSGGPGGNGAVGQSAFYSTKTSPASGGKDGDPRSGDGGNGAFFDAGTFGGIISAQAGKTPGGGGGGAYDYGQNSSGQGGVGKVEVVFDSGLSYYSTPTASSKIIYQDGNSSSLIFDTSVIGNESFCFVTVSFEWTQGGNYIGPMGASSTDIYDFYIVQNGEILLSSGQLSNTTYAPDTTQPATQSFLLNNFSYYGKQPLSLYIQGGYWLQSSATYELTNIVVSLYDETSVHTPTNGGGVNINNDALPSYVFSATSSGILDETMNLLIPLDVSNVPPKQYLAATVTANWAQAGTASTALSTDSITIGLTNTSIGNAAASKQWTTGEADYHPYTFTFSGPLSPSFVNGSPLELQGFYPANISAWPYQQPFTPFGFSLQSASVVINTVGNPANYDLYNNYTHLVTNLTSYFNTGFSLTSSFTDNTGSTFGAPTRLLWKLTGGNPSTREVIYTFTGSDADNEYDATAIIQNLPPGTKLVFSDIVLDSSGSIFELPLNVQSQPSYYYNPGVRQGTTITTQSLEFDPSGSAQFVSVFYDNNFYGFAKEFGVLELPYPEQVVVKLGFITNFPSGSFYPHS